VASLSEFRELVTADHRRDPLDAVGWRNRDLIGHRPAAGGAARPPRLNRDRDSGYVHDFTRARSYIKVIYKD
jgi:hypothetical protein